MAIKLANKSWPFATKAEALKKLATMKDKDAYEVVQNRVDKKFAKGWVLRKKSK